VKTRRREGGGLAGTALVAAAKLGARAAWCGPLDPADELSRYTIEQLEAGGVDCSMVKHVPGSRPFHSTIIVERSSGQRTILASNDGVMQLATEDITENLLGQTRVLFVDHTAVESCTRAAQLARAQDIPVVGDIEREGNGVAELLRHVDHLILGIEAGRRLTGQTAAHAILKRLLGPERTCAVVTAGETGCWYAERDGKVQRMPAYKVDVVDTTGCGDVFHGAYAAALSRGESVEACIRTASATAAIKATQPGGRGGIPDRATVEAFIANHQNRD
jgi:sugar/nucleoside kinase (ribokinase family)